MKFVNKEPHIGSIIRIKSLLELKESAKKRDIKSLNTIISPNSVYTIYDIVKNGTEYIYRIKINRNDNVYIYREEFDLI